MGWSMAEVYQGPDRPSISVRAPCGLLLEQHPGPDEAVIRSVVLAARRAVAESAEALRPGVVVVPEVVELLVQGEEARRRLGTIGRRSIIVARRHHVPGVG